MSALVKRIVLSLHRRGFLDCLTDKMYLKLMFRVKMDRKLDLKTPKTYNEKLQWLKLYDRKPEYSTMVDKYEAKKYIAEQVGEEYIIPTIGVWEKFDDIDFDALPDQFVLKCTHDSGGLVICQDKSKLDLAAVRAKIERCLTTDYYLRGREWPYKNVKPRIIAEKFIEDGDNQYLMDYKFFCFNGNPKCLYICRMQPGDATDYLEFLSLDWKRLPFTRGGHIRFEKLPPKPVNYEKMLEFSKKLSEGLPSLRVDFYEVGGKLYIGELTFFTGSGYIEFDPPEWDEKIGQWLELPPKK